MKDGTSDWDGIIKFSGPIGTAGENYEIKGPSKNPFLKSL
jgi:hypothetical protein